ncbi:MAG TPA: MBL fold metallo-hydrolase [Myxococcales bacterium]|nr:MBL fold metallo-hydrolase [Myxococcales bacterium]
MRRRDLFRVALALLMAENAAIGCSAFSAPGYRGATSDHFDGQRFHNEDPIEQPARSLMKWALHRHPGGWRGWTDAPPGPPPPRRVGGADLRVTFVNHATVLIQTAGLNILTDPIWSDRCSPVPWAGPRRVRSPGLRFEDLPPIDVVLVSHDHYDHLDLPTDRRLQQAFRPRFVTGLGNGKVLRRAGVPHATELDWWQGLDVAPGVRVTAVPAQHFSNRSLLDRNDTLWEGFVIQGPAGSVYFAGDTGYGRHFAEIRRRFGPIRLAVLPIGAYRPEWFMGPVHMSPAQAVRAQADLDAATAVAIHFGTFRLADDGQDEPVEALQRALERTPKPRFWVLGFGEGREVPPVVDAPLSAR